MQAVTSGLDIYLEQMESVISVCTSERTSLGRLLLGCSESAGAEGPPPEQDIDGLLRERVVTAAARSVPGLGNPRGVHVNAQQSPDAPSWLGELSG
jgi:hypothetical protein